MPAERTPGQGQPRVTRKEMYGGAETVDVTAKTILPPDLIPLADVLGKVAAAGQYEQIGVHFIDREHNREAHIVATNPSGERKLDVELIGNWEIGEGDNLHVEPAGFNGIAYRRKTPVDPILAEEGKFYEPEDPIAAGTYGKGSEPFPILLDPTKYPHGAKVVTCYIPDNQDGLVVEEDTPIFVLQKREQPSN